MDMESKSDLVGSLRRYRETLRWETEFLRFEVTSRGLETLAGKKDYLEKHSRGRSLSRELPQLKEQLSGQKITSMPVVSLPYLVPHHDHEEALDLLLHEAHKLGYRIQSLSELAAVPVSLETARLLYLLSERCAEISRVIARQGSPNSSKSCADAAVAAYKERRVSWESIWGSPVLRSGAFNDITTLSPMYFTPSAPAIIPYTGFATMALQIYSFEICDLNDSLKWPLYVYGVVAARDVVDGNRNLLFSRSRANCQVLTEKDPFLHLSGPSRAILAEYPVDFEVELRVKDGTESQDEALMSSTNHHIFATADTAVFFSCLCCAKLSLETVFSAVQATILSISVVGGGSCFEYGGQVSCSLYTEGVIADECREVVLIDCDEKFLEDGLGSSYVSLSRNVVTVKSEGSLKITIKEYTKSHLVAHEAQLDFPAQHCQVSTRECVVGEHKVVVVIAWSLLVRDKLNNLASGC
ncbi:hypothetical protein ZWY2020_011501 [Hordeum vulgare]|nr:hypothetical protein ZWY2020_011501 [Hordeum vulgare]